MVAGWGVIFIIGLVLAPLIGMVWVGLIALRNERFRATMKALLAVPLAVVIAFVVAKAMAPHGRETALVDPGEIGRETALVDSRGTVAPSRPDGPHEFDHSLAMDHPAELPAASQAADAQDGGVRILLRALSKALVRTMADGHSPSAAAAAEEAPAKSLTATPVLAERVPQPGEPDWVDSPPQQVGGAYRMPVAVGPFATRGECDRELPRALNAAVDEYVGQYLGMEAGGRVGLPLEYIRKNVVREEWLENRRVSVSPTKEVPMVRLHVLLEFDREVNQRLDEGWRQSVVHGKLWTLGGAGALVLLLLSTFWAYLRTDLATGGAYRGRLRLATGLALVLVVLAGLAVLG